MSGLIDEVLLCRQIATGDELAFKQLFEHYQLKLLAFAIRFTHSDTDAEEIIQDVFLKVWLNRSNLANVSSPGKYIFIMTRNRVMDHLTKIARDKKLRQQVWANIHDSGDYTEQTILAAEAAGIVRSAVHRLSDRKQNIYFLSRHEGLSHQEIADRLGISVITVKNSMVEILRYIKNYLHTQYNPTIPFLVATLAAAFLG